MKYLFFLLFSFVSSYAIDDAFRKHDLNFYSPVREGLSDLSIEIHFPNLTDELNKRLIYGELKDVFFKYYFLAPNKVDIDIVGMPEGFIETKQELKAVVIPVLEFINPMEVKSKFQSFNFKKNSQSSSTYTGHDPQFQSGISEISITFGKNSLISEMTVKRPTGTETTSFTYSKKPWSKNKFVIDKIESKVTVGALTGTTTKEIEYSLQSGYGLPISIKTLTNQKIPAIGQEQEEFSDRQSEGVISLRNASVNAEAAKRYFP